MTEHDLDQKLDMRRAFWAMGASTRVDVKLSALVPRQKGRSGTEEWTDLDVLAVSYAPLLGATYSVADCKTLKGRVTERVFWLRGVADLLSAKSAYLTRDEEVPAASRQLALRLGINILDRNDRVVLIEQVGTTHLPQEGTFLDKAALIRWIALTADVPKSLDRLQRYRRAGYWIAPRHRNLTFLPNLMRDIARDLRPQDLWAMALVIDVAWLYANALIAAIDEMTRLHLAQPAISLRQMVVGSEQELRERQLLADRLEAIIAALPRSTPRPEIDVLPPYFQNALDLVERLLDQRHALVDVLRVLEFTGIETVANRGVKWADAFPAADPVAVKLASDVVRFVVRASSLDPGFVTGFNATVRRDESRARGAAVEGFFPDDQLAPGLDEAQSRQTIENHKQDDRAAEEKHDQQ